MTGWMMRRMRPGGFAWLVLHELRIATRARKSGWVMNVVGALVLIGYLALGTMLAVGLRGEVIPVTGMAYSITLLASAGLFTFMTTQAILASQRTLYQNGDLELLLTAPMPPRTVIAAKLVGIVGAIALTFAFLILPLVLPVAVLGHPELFGIVLLLVALALTAACVGLAITLVIARIAGPRAARTAGQVLAALSGGAVFLASQILNGTGREGRRQNAEWIERALHDGFGTSGIGALPGRAAFGDSIAMLLVFGFGFAVFALTAWAMQGWFLTVYRAGGMHLSRNRRARTPIAKHFHRSLDRAVLAKEWKLLARDPALAFQLVLRIIYLAPLLLIALRHDDSLPLAPTLAFSSVLIAGQVIGSLAWLAASAEDAPDLITVSPVDKESLDNAKLTAALLMGAPLSLLLPIGIAMETVPGAIVTIVMTGFAGGLIGWLEVTNAKPAPRSTFQRRRSGSILLGLFEFVIAGAVGLLAGVLVRLIQLWF